MGSISFLSSCFCVFSASSLHEKRVYPESKCMLLYCLWLSILVLWCRRTVHSCLKSMEAVKAPPSMWWQLKDCTHMSENMEAITALMPFPVMMKDCIQLFENMEAVIAYSRLANDCTHLSENVVAVTTHIHFPIMTKDCTHLSENMVAVTAHIPFLMITKDCTHLSEIWRRPQPLPRDDKGMYTHLSENIEAITAPMPCPMMTKDCARPPSNFRSHTRSNCSR